MSWWRNSATCSKPHESPMPTLPAHRPSTAAVATPIHAYPGVQTLPTTVHANCEGDTADAAPRQVRAKDSSAAVVDAERMKHLFPCESESQLYAHIERLRLAEIERERVERMDRAREARILREYHLWMMGRE